VASAGGLNASDQHPSQPRSGLSDNASRALPLSFNKCLGAIIYVGVHIGVAPINIVETIVTRMARFDTEDGSVLITCSRPDQKMVITRIIFE
jgi:hypothetical protein